MAIENVALSLGLPVSEYNGLKADMMVFLFREGREPTDASQYTPMIESISAANNAISVFTAMGGPFILVPAPRTGQWLVARCTHILAVLGALENADEPRSE